MMPLLAKWEEIRVIEKNANNILMPILYYSKETITALCEKFNTIKETCQLERCFSSDPIGSFVNAHFSYVCTDSKFDDNQKCISSSLQNSNCTDIIQGTPQFGATLLCEKFEAFDQCANAAVTKSCGPEAYENVQSAIVAYGCSMEDSRLASTETTTMEITTSVENVTKNSTIEEEASGEAETATEEMLTIEAATTTTTAFVPTRPPAKHRHHGAKNMTDCYTSIMADFGRLLQSAPHASFVRFPLFGVKAMELDAMCAKFDVLNDCVASFCVGNCRFPPIKTFVDTQLNAACRLRNTDTFEMDFTCLQTSLLENPECVAECISEKLQEECSDDTVKLLEEMQKGMECKLLNIDDDVVEEGSAEGSGVEGSGEDFKSIADGENSLIDVRAKCNEEVEIDALRCVAPMLKLWTGIKENRVETKVVFPIFRFSKIELMELCDSYVNYKRCMFQTRSQACKSLPVIRFADEHFGQVCTTETIEASIRTYDCIQGINPKYLKVCNMYTKGETMPGKRKCGKVRRYTKCLRKHVEDECGHLILAHYDHVVDWFGC
ncbi:unnamed protein product [Caenorhabditis bovis]|uniref:DUF19 domain-containing protein n=1 Tax=Caenorhabditis bovis TaxID=2654633 RepID=A0A8S1EDB5_9PELO|nr:unnamed protein product [Caenorhabditis bovis]